MEKGVKRGVIVFGFFMFFTLILTLSYLSKPVSASGGIFGFFKSPDLDKTYSFSAPVFLNGTPSMEDLEISADPGNPYTVYKTVKLLIPYGREVDSVEVIGKNRQYAGNVHMEYGKQFATTDSLNGDVNMTPVEKNQSVYNLDEYPGVLNSDFQVQKLKGYQVLMLNIFPMQYSPKTNDVYYYNTMEVKVYLKGGKALQSVENRGVRNIKEDIDSVNSFVDNQDTVSSYPSATGASTATMSTTTTLDSADFNPSEKYDYIIITTQQFNNSAFQDLINWKKSKGLKARIVLLEDILANPDFSCSGIYGDGCNQTCYNDTQAKIRNFIKFAYQKWQIQYVLLGGDADGGSVGGESGNNIIPVRLFYPRYTEYTNDGLPSDNYYSNLDGSLDYNQNCFFAEPGDGENGGEDDLIAEVYIGRAPIDSLQEVSNFVKKTIDYENYTMHQPTDYNNIDPYLKKAVMAGEYLGFGGPVEYGDASKEEVFLGSSEYNYTTVGFPSGYNVDKLYDGQNEWTASDMINEMNSGVNIINHLGHASNNDVMKICHNLYNDCTYCSGQNLSDLNYLTNTKYFFVYSQACYPGSFDNWNYEGCYSKTDSIAENLVVKENGAFAVIMNSRYGWGRYSTTDSPAQRFDRQFFDAVFGEGKTKLGEANQDSKEDNIGGVMGGYYGADESRLLRWTYYELNLLGDPETSLYVMPAPNHNLQVKEILVNTSQNLNPKQTYSFPVVIDNTGKNTETDVQVLLKINGNTVDSKIVPSLAINSSIILNFSWYTNVGGKLNLAAEISKVDDISQDNVLTENITVTPFAFTGKNYADYGLDTNGNGLYNYLVTEVELDSVYSGPATFSTNLNYNDSLQVAYFTQLINVTYGINRISLPFKRFYIINYNLSGKFSLSSVSYSVYSDKGYASGSANKLYNTSYYNYSQFDAAPIKFIGQFLDYPYDTDGNGLYDYLVMAAKVNVTEPGNYRIYGTVLPEKSSAALYSTSNVYNFNKTGVYNINFPASGILINQRNATGKFNLTFLSIYDAANTDVYNFLGSISTYQSKSYNDNDFEGDLGASFNNSFSERVIDVNNDGLYDFLIIGIGLNVTRSGVYTLPSMGLYNLQSNGWIGSTTSIQYLEKGSREMKLYFLGTAIERTSISPENDKFFLYSPANTYGISVGQVYNTTTYNTGSFQNNGSAYSGMADLSVSSLLLSNDFIDENEDFNLTAAMYNNGGSSVGGFNVSFFNNGVLIKKVSVAGLDNHSSVNVSTQLKLNRGVYALAAVADYEDNIKESLKSNNVANRVLVIGEPSLGICGNNITEQGEQCDGTNLAGKTCLDYGFSAGNLTCLLDCSNINISKCINDTVYPIFSNYQDNNGTLQGSGTALFNVTVSGTNGSVFLNINNQRIPASNVSDKYSASVTLANGTYMYNWTSYGKGTSHNANVSTNRYYTIISSACMNNDNDHDGWNATASCNSNNLSDCDDNDAARFLGNPETCDNKDNNCDNLIDNGIALQSCGTGICAGNQTCSAGIWGSCSSNNRDAGTCAKCSSGAIVYDSTQNSDCSDNNICNGNESCKAIGQCNAGVALNCNDNVACTEDVCNPISGCQYSENNTKCGDAFSCTNDVCNTLSGCSNTKDDSKCSPGERCIAYNNVSCATQVTNCSGVQDGVSCDDGLANCTIGRTCLNQTCQGGQPKDCSSFNLPGINGCNDSSDNNQFTKDFRQQFTSSCQGSSGNCNQGNSSITHACDFSCGAACKNNSDALCPGDVCAGNDLQNYPVNGVCNQQCIKDNSSCIAILEIDSLQCKAIVNYTININSGVNFVSIPLLLLNYSIDNVTSGNSNKIDKIYAYDGSWKAYYTNNPSFSSLREFNAGQGYVLFANQSFNLVLYGYTKTGSSAPYSRPSFTLKQGWNLLGVMNNKTVSQALTGVSYSSVYKYNSGNYASLNNSAVLEKGKGYWVYMNSAGSIMSLEEEDSE